MRALNKLRELIGISEDFRAIWQVGLAVISTGLVNLIGWVSELEAVPRFLISIGMLCVSLFLICRIYQWFSQPEPLLTIDPGRRNSVSPETEYRQPLPINTGKAFGQLRVELDAYLFRSRTYVEEELSVRLAPSRNPLIETYMILHPSLPMRFERIELRLEGNMISPLKDIEKGKIKRGFVNPIFEIRGNLAQGQKEAVVAVLADDQWWTCETFTINFDQQSVLDEGFGMKSNR